MRDTVGNEKGNNNQVTFATFDCFSFTLTKTAIHVTVSKTVF